MESTELAVSLIILFVPGIIVTFVYEICQHRQDLSNRDFVINVVMSAFITYSVTYLFLKAFGGESTFLDALLDSSKQINKTEILLASALAVVFGYLEVKLVRRMMTFTREREELNKKVRLSVWDDLFDEGDGYDGHVKVILKEQGVIYDGYVEKYSASLSNRKELFLRNAVKYDLATGNEIRRDINGIYLQIRDDEDVIMEMLLNSGL